MQVALLAHTPDPDSVVAGAARLCYSNIPLGELASLGGLAPQGEGAGRFIARLRRSGHMSPFEHASFTFGVEGLSRVASHQLVRHRLASYSQRSQRYVSMYEAIVVVPKSVEERPDATAVFTRAAEQAKRAYSELVAMGVPAEDARFILPHGLETALVFTMNARELHHFFSLRLCRRAQWEIRELARRMLKHCRPAAPLLFELAGPPCVFGGEQGCREQRPCGKPYIDMKDLLQEDHEH